MCHWLCEDTTQSQEMVKEAVAEVMFVACWAVGVSTGMHKEEKCDVIVTQCHDGGQACTGVLSFPFS